MSKSLGNSPDPLKLIEEYGADGVRMGMMLSAPAGNDILFDESLCEQGRNFCNKIWNAFRLVEGWNVDNNIAQPDTAKTATEWFAAQLRKSEATLNDLFSKYRISEALMEVYHLFWDEFSSWYLEMIKPAYGEPIDGKTMEATLNATVFSADDFEKSGSTSANAKTAKALCTAQTATKNSRTRMKNCLQR